MEPPNFGTSEPANSGALELDALFARAHSLARDHDSGAAEITSRLLVLLADAIAAGGDTPLAIARIVLAGQPAMAPLWHACAAAVGEHDRPGSFARRRAEMERVSSALVRAATMALRDLLAGEDSPLILAWSYSSAVSGTLRELSASRTFRVACAEGRPRFEGRRLALELAGSGLDVVVTTDAALTLHLPDAAAIVTGADAVTADGWINKVGTFGLCAAGGLSGVPVYVIATKDKFVPQALADRMLPAGSDPEEVWPDAPPGILVSNRYFERTPAHLATLFLTESGPLGPADLAGATQARLAELSDFVVKFG